MSCNRLAFDQPVRSGTNIADALGVTYERGANNIAELVAQGVAGSYSKLIRFPGVSEALA